MNEISLVASSYFERKEINQISLVASR